MRSTGVAYLLWLTCLVGLSGTHRIYSGRYISGIIWIFTFGFFGIGQLIDLALIPSMVEDKNLKYKLLHGSPQAAPSTQQVVINLGEQSLPLLNVSKTTTSKSDIQIILELAKTNSGHVSLADCIIATGKPVSEVKNILNSLCSEGVLEIDNHQDSGAIIYKIA